jgi:hypothetical protein
MKIAILFIIPMIISSCWSYSDHPYFDDDGSYVESCPDAVTDSSTVTCGGKTYRTVIIGSQTWMAENICLLAEVM